MCLAIPMKIVSIQKPGATVEAAGLKKEIRIDFLDDLKPGDYVMVHAGFAIQKMSEQEALENIKLFEEIQNV